MVSDSLFRPQVTGQHKRTVVYILNSGFVNLLMIDEVVSAPSHSAANIPSHMTWVIVLVYSEGDEEKETSRLLPFHCFYAFTVIADLTNGKGAQTRR